MNRLVMIICVLIALTIWLNVSIVVAAGPKISQNGNVHNLSSTNITVTYHADPGGTDPRKDQICIFCHTPHNSLPQTPLWSRKETTKQFSVYSSATLVISRAGVIDKSYPGNLTRQPDGTSKLCLSCHDGITALGAIRPNPNSPISFSGGKDTLPAFNMSNHHPVSFVYDNAVWAYLPPSEYLDPNTTGINSIKWNSGNEVRLDRSNKMQCTACHNPHQNQTDDSGPNSMTPFWVKGGTSPYDAVCTTCHIGTTVPTGLPTIRPN